MSTNKDKAIGELYDIIGKLETLPEYCKTKESQEAAYETINVFCDILNVVQLLTDADWDTLLLFQDILNEFDDSGTEVELKKGLPYTIEVTPPSHRVTSIDQYRSICNPEAGITITTVPTIVDVPDYRKFDFGIGINEQSDLVSWNREPQPTDGPEYHADHQAWQDRQEQNYLAKTATFQPNWEYYAEPRRWN